MQSTGLQAHLETIGLSLDLNTEPGVSSGSQNPCKLVLVQPQYCYNPFLQIQPIRSVYLKELGDLAHMLLFYLEVVAPCQT